MRNRFRLNLILIVCAILFTLFLVELFLRIVKRDDQRGTLRISDLVVNHRLRENFFFNLEWEKGRKIPYFTNSLGFRDSRIRNIEPLSSSKRIIFFGDSFTEGVGVNYEDTFVAKIERLLRNDGLNIEVLNAGTVSYSPLLKYFRLVQLLERNIKFDLVVLVLDISDVQDQVYYNSIYEIKNKPILFRSNLTNFYNESFLFRFIWNKLSQVKNNPIFKEKKTAVPFVGPLFYQERSLFTEDVKIYKKWGERGILLLMRDMGRINSLLTLYHIPFVVVIYPWKTQLESKIIPSIFEIKIISYCKQMKIEIINLFPDFRKATDWEKLFLLQDVHWNAQGHTFVAERLREYFKKIGLTQKLAASLKN